MALAKVEHPQFSHTNGNGTHDHMQDSFDEHLPARLLLWLRIPKPIRDWLEWGWAKFVVTKSAEGKYSISQPLALVLLAIIGGFCGTWWWTSTSKMQAQHDEIIRLQTKLDLEASKNIDQDSKIDQARNYATIADKNSARLEGKFDQFALMYSIKNANKANGGIAE